MFTDVAISKDFFPQTFLRYIPNANLDKNEKINIMAIVTLKEL